MWSPGALRALPMGTAVSRENTRLRLRGIARAVMELRRRKGWDKTQFARQFHGYGSVGRPPTRVTISRWETGSHQPSISHRTRLGKIAIAQKLHSLHEVFNAQPDGTGASADTGEEGEAHR